MKVKVKVPTRLADITLEQYQKWDAVMKKEGDHRIMMFSIFCGVDRSVAKQMKLAEVTETCRAIQAILDNELPKHHLVVSHEGKRFGFIPNLSDMSLGEYIDIDSNISDWATMHKALAVLYRPVTQTFKQLYAIEEYETTAKYSEAMKKLPLEVVYGALGFMFRLGMDLSKATLQSMVNSKEIQSLLHQKSSSLNDGDGTASFMPLQMVVSLALTQSQKSM
jgi:hypothetical protein